jgi:hypothetical protein
MPIANDAGNSSPLGDEQNVFNGAETGLPGNNDPLSHVCSDCSPELPLRGDRVNRTTDLTEPKETH